MLVKGATREQILAAVKFAGERFGDNLTVKRLDFAGRTRNGADKYTLTITVKSSAGPGARRSPEGRRIAAACWHAHGALIDAMPDGVTVDTSTGAGGLRTVKPGDKWHDWRINDLPGSVWYYTWASSLCECEPSDAYAAGQTSRDARGLNMPADAPADADWPTFRRDNARSGYTKADLPAGGSVDLVVSDGGGNPAPAASAAAFWMRSTPDAGPMLGADAGGRLARIAENESVGSGSAMPSDRR